MSACITYLSFTVFETGPCTNDTEFEARLRDYALLDYAAKHWGHHARCKEETCQEMVLAFLQNNSKVLCASQVMNVPGYRYSGYSEWFPRSISGVHVAASFGMETTVHNLLKSRAEPDLKDSNGRTPLSWAAEGGHLEVVKLLSSNTALPI